MSVCPALVSKTPLPPHKEITLSLCCIPAFQADYTFITLPPLYHFLPPLLICASIISLPTSSFLWTEISWFVKVYGWRRLNTLHAFSGISLGPDERALHAYR